MKRFVEMAAAAALIVGLATPARAVTLATPLVEAVTAGFVLLCTVTNVGTKDATIASVKFFNINGTEVAPLIGPSCPATLAPKDTCSFAFPGPNGHCEVSASGKIRAAAQISNAAGDSVLVAPATK